MAISHRARTLLFALSEDDIKLIASKSRFCAPWAQKSKIARDELLRGTGRAAKAVRAAMRKEPQPFVDDLADFAANLIGDLVLSGSEGDDRLASAVQAFAGVVTPSVAKVCLTCVADSQLSLSAEVAYRLDELIELADSPVEFSEEEEAVGSSETEDADSALLEVGQRDVADETVEARSDLPQRLKRTQQLRLDGQELAARLKAAAIAAERGEPTVSVAAESDIWSAAVHDHLEDSSSIARAQDLSALEEALNELLNQHESKLADARKAIETVAFLRSQGLEAVVAATLLQLGFGSLEEAEQLLGNSSESEVAGIEVLSEQVQGSGAESRECASEVAVSQDSVSGSDEVELGAKLASSTADAKAGEEGDLSVVLTPVPSVGSVSDVDANAASAPTYLSPSAELPTPIEHQWGNNPPDDRGLKQDSLSERAVVLPSRPWDEGESGSAPLIAELIMENKFALACHVAAASPQVSEHQRLLLELTCAAARCSSIALEPALPHLFPKDSDVEFFGTDEIRVLLAASLRAGLRLGYAPIGLSTLIDRADLAATRLEAVVHALAVTVQRGRTRESTSSTGSGEELASRWSELGREAKQLRDRLERKNLVDRRTSRLLHHLVRESEPLGNALSAAAALCEGGIDRASASEWAELEALASDLSDQSKRDRIIAPAHRAISNGPKRKEVIQDSARIQLHESLSAISELLGRLSTVRRAILNADDIKGVESAHELDRALAAAPPNLIARTVGDAALINLANWRRSSVIDQASDSLDGVLDRELLSLFEIPRDEAGRPTRAATASEVALLLEPRSPRDVVEGHLARGDLAAARMFIADRGLDDEYDDDVLRAGRDAQQLHDSALAEAELGAARLRSLYKDDLARELAGEVDALRVPIPDRFDLTIDALRAISVRADAELNVIRADLVERTRAATGSDADKARIIDLIERRDETLAVEFITSLESGQSLPEVAPDHGDDFCEFYPDVVDVAAKAQSVNRDPLAAAREFLSGSTEPEDRQLRDGLRGWSTVRKNKRRDIQAFRAGVAEVLRMIGLVPRSTDWLREISRIQRSGYATFRVWASPVDRSYVPQLGTQAHNTYDITLVWDRATPARLLDFIDERNRATQANLIFYFDILSSRDRVQLRNLTLPGRGKGFSPLVIDEAVIAWLTSRQEPGWRFTQRVTLPFTTMNPYSPFAGGEVPDEVFVGRDDERRRIEDPTGSMFVYGGRQLGKSALLRRVERLFNQSSHGAGDPAVRSGNVAVYVDLKAAGIGEAREPAELWPLLGERLRHAGILGGKSNHAATADEVTSQLKKWLDAEPDNRLLLLLDEADNFLTVDAKPGASSTRGAFPVLQALKGVMESSHRRFKPVFAGLHQVQRFHDTSNTPVAHGGEDILIGPLKSRDAYSLVVDPLTALGYEFAHPELVWQLLLVTNYQASLVQIVCEALVRHLQTRPLPTESGRILVTEKDVRAVCEDKAVQDLIAQRFRWTINLDSRYRVIALVVALRSRAVNEPASAFSVDDLRDDCETFWHVGFNRDVLSRKEFERYLAEMVGLGVLHRQGERYGLRSPNIVRMLGSAESLDQELQDAEKHLEPPFEYNPTMTRQIFGDSAGFWMPRSPLTDHELATLLAERPSKPVQLVCGSEALAVERAAPVVAAAAKMRNMKCIMSSSMEIPELDAHHFGARTHAVIDLIAMPPDAGLESLVQRLSGRRNFTATIVVGAQFIPMLSGLNLPVHFLRRWSVDGLRAWYESPFDSPLLRQRLFRVTSGWPKLVERAMQSVRDGSSTSSALSELIEYLATQDVARATLSSTAIDPTVAEQWATWFTTPSSATDSLVESQSVPVADLTEALGRDAAPVLEQLEALDLVAEDDGSWILDRVVIAAAAQLFN